MPNSSSAAASSATLSMLLADARLPVGGHVYSAGLEPALRAGMPTGSVMDYMIGRARTISLVEAGTAVVSRHFCLTEPTLSLLAVESAWAARTPSKAARAVSRALGRGYLRLTEQLWHLPPSVLALRENGGQLSRAVILGAVAAVAGLDAQSLVRLVVYDDAQTIASALLKLEPLDPLRPQRWVLRACAAAEPHVPALADLTSPDAIPAFGTPQIEEWTEAHSRLTQRLFRA